MAKKRDIVIAGYSETPVEFKSGRSAYDFGGEALAKLLQSTGIPKSEIDGMAVAAPLSECPNPFFPVYMAEALGLSPKWLNYSGTGGCSATGGIARLQPSETACAKPSLFFARMPRARPGERITEHIEGSFRNP